MNYFHTITVTSTDPNTPKDVVVTSNNILIKRSTAYLSFHHKIKPTIEDLASTVFLTSYHQVINEDRLIYSVTSEPLPDNLQILFSKIHKIHVSLQMAIDSNDLDNVESSQLWRNLIPVLVQLCKKLFPNHNPDRSAFHIHTKDHQVFSWNKNPHVKDPRKPLNIFFIT